MRKAGRKTIGPVARDLHLQPQGTQPGPHRVDLFHDMNGLQPASRRPPDLNDHAPRLTRRHGEGEICVFTPSATPAPPRTGPHPPRAVLAPPGGNTMRSDRYPRGQVNIGHGSSPVISSALRRINKPKRGDVCAECIGCWMLDVSALSTRFAIDPAPCPPSPPSKSNTPSKTPPTGRSALSLDFEWLVPRVEGGWLSTCNTPRHRPDSRFPTYYLFTAPESAWSRYGRQTRRHSSRKSRIR